MKLITALILLCTTTTATAGPFSGGNPEAGQQLFEKLKCNRCHIKIAGGNGNGIFTRPNRKVRSATELLKQIHNCGANVGVTFTSQEQLDIGAYLNRFYNLK